MKKISWRELAIHYLESELCRYLPKSRREISVFLNSLSEEDLNRLLFGLSTFFRANYMHEVLCDIDAVWYFKKVSADRIYFEGFHSEEIDMILRLKVVDHNPHLLVKYLNNDPKLSKKYSSLLTKQDINKQDILFGQEISPEGNLIKIVDGYHRTLNYILNEKKDIPLYVKKYSASLYAEKILAPQTIYQWIKRLSLGSSREEFNSFKGFLKFIDKKYIDSNNGKTKYWSNELSETEIKDRFDEKISKLL